METLFPYYPEFPEGFLFIPDFLNADEEKILLHEISRIPLHTFMFQGFEAKRKVASFGYNYSFDKRTISKGQDIPGEFQWLVRKISSLFQDKKTFEALLITEYPVGSVINWHRDAPPFEAIAGISLLSDCIFRFRPYDKTHQKKKSITSFVAKRRSLYIMTGVSRTLWEHSILPVTAKRYSITLRTLRES